MKRLTITLLALIFVFNAQAQIIPDYYPDQLKQLLQNDQDPWHGNSSTIQSAETRTDVFGDPPSWKWAKQYGGDGTDSAFDVTEDEQNNTYSIGSFQGTINIGGNTYTSTGRLDMFIAKVSGTGDVIWFKTFSPQAGEYMRGTSIKYKNGSLVLAGYIEGSTDFGTGGTTISSDSDPVSFIGEIDEDGVFMWYKSYWNQTLDSRFAIKIDRDNVGNIYLLTGRFFSTFSPDGTLTKFDENGNLLLEINEQIFINRFELTSLGMYVTGSVTVPVTIGSVSFEPPTFKNAYVAKSDLNFNFEWGHIVDIGPEGFGDSDGVIIAADAAENVYFGGYFGNSASINNMPAPDEINFGLYYVKLDFNGEFQWVSYIDNTTFFTLPSKSCLSSSGDLISSGYLFNTYESLDGTIISPTNTNTSLFLVLDKDDGSIENELTNSIEINSLRNNGFGNALTAGSQGGNLSFGTLDANNEDDWTVKTSGESGFTSGYVTQKVIIDDDANNYAITRHHYNLYFDDLEKTSEAVNATIIKTDVNGNPIWISGLESSININTNDAQISPDQSSIIIGGSYSGIIETNLGNFSTSSNRGYFAKFDINTGALLVFKDFDASVSGISIDQNDKIIITGTFFETAIIDGITLVSNGGNDYFVAKFNELGELSWAGSFGGTSFENQPQIDVDGMGNIYTYTRSSSNFINFGNGIELFLEDGEGDVIITKHDPNGTPLWAINFAGTSATNSSDFSGSPYGLYVTENGEIFIEGRMGYDNNFGTIQLQSPYYNQNNPGPYTNNNFLAKLNTDGEFIWANIINKEFDFVSSFQITPDEIGNLYITGAIRSDTYFSDEAFLEVNDNEQIGFVAKYDTLGQISWVKSIDNDDSRPSGIGVFAEDQITICGDFFNTLDLAGNSFSANTTNGFLVSTTDQATSTTPTPANVFKLNTDPNPFTDQFVLGFELEQNTTVKLRIFDLQGRLVKRINLGMRNSGNHRETINMDGLTTGMYFINMMTDKKSGVVKVEKIK